MSFSLAGPFEMENLDSQDASKQAKARSSLEWSAAVNPKIVSAGWRKPAIVGFAMML